MLTCAIDAYQKRDIMSLDIPNAYIQADVPVQKVGERIVMKIRGDLVDWLCEIDPASYLPYVVVERGVEVLYFIMTKAIYGVLQAGLLWYRKLCSDFEGQGFLFNAYGPCVANRNVNNEQHTIRFHVDDFLLSYKDPKVNDNFA